MKLFLPHCPELFEIGLVLGLFFPRANQFFFYQFVSPQDHLESTLWNWQSKQSDSNSAFCILFDGPVHGKTVCTVFMTGKPIVGPPKTSSDRLHPACFQFPIQFHVGLYLSDSQFPIQIFIYRLIFNSKWATSGLVRERIDSSLAATWSRVSGVYDLSQLGPPKSSR